jgi:proline iminopeptidase
MASKRKATRRLRKTNTSRKPRRVATARKRKPIVPAGLRTLYPVIEPFNKGMLRVSAEHEIYFEECGNPKGKPVVFVHGGPGAGCDVRARRFFNPDAYRIVLFDQRGCGRSKPHASLVDNTTWHLVADMELLRQHLKINTWQVFGGSWGSTLALAYAQTHPALFPDRFDQYRSAIPVNERHDLIAAFYKRLSGSNRSEMIKAARAWSVWEAATSFIHTNNDMIDKWDGEDFAIAIARIECHYFVNKGFLEHEDQLLHNVDRVRHIPCVIVQGRYDVVCPMQTAWELHKAWPEAEFKVVPDAGHSAFEVGNTHELILATDKFAAR